MVQDAVLKWQTVIERIEQRGFSQRRIAMVLKCDKKQIYRFKRGLLEPRFSQWVKLLEMAAKSEPTLGSWIKTVMVHIRECVK